MNNTLYSGQDILLSLQPGQSLGVYPIIGTYSASIVAGAANMPVVLATNSAATQVHGPFASAVNIFLDASALGRINYDVAVTPVNIVSGYDTANVAITGGTISGAALLDLAASTGASLVGYSAGQTYAAATIGAKLKDSVSVKDAPFNCVVDGVTDDTAGFQAALNAATTVYIPSGVLLRGNVTIPAGRTVIGAGRTATTLRMKNSINVNGDTMLNVNDIEFRDLTLDGNKANNLTAGSGAFISGTSSRIFYRNVRITGWREAGVAASTGTSFIEGHNIRVDNNTTDGWQMTAVNYPGLFNSTCELNGRYGAVYGSACTSMRESANVFRNNMGGGSIMVGGNDAVRLGNIADTNGTGHGLQYNATVRGVYVGNIAKSNGISGLDYTLGASYGTTVGNISFSNAVRGIEIDSASFYTAAVGNVVYRNGEVGISVYRAPATILIGNHAIENGTTTTPKHGIRLWDDVNTLPSSKCLLIGNNSSDDRGGSATQTHGLSVEAASTSGVMVDANNFSNNLTAPVIFVAGSIKRARDNLGFVTQNEGFFTIPSGSTSAVIAHGLSVTPKPSDFTFNTYSNAINQTGPFSVTAITSTNATINCRLDPGVGGTTIGWSVTAF